MELIEHTISWVKGEILEAIIMSIFGVLIVLCSVLLWKFGTTAYAKSLVIPMLVVGLIPLLMGMMGAINNNQRIPTYQQAWQTNPEQFSKDEKVRVKGFDEIFKYSYPAAVILTVGGAILFFLLASPTWKGISLAMMTLGLMAYFIDYFASERADIYLQHIEEALKNQ